MNPSGVTNYIFKRLSIILPHMRKNLKYVVIETFGLRLRLAYNPD